MTTPEIILDHLRTLYGDGRTLDELVHELTVLRRAAKREMPPMTRDGVRLSLETLEADRHIRREGEQWFYAPVSGPAQGRLFDDD